MLRGIIRVSAFFRKELAEVLRQPRLLLSLILGPFLILLLFGIGYSGQARVLSTLLVVSKGSLLETQAQDYAMTLGSQLKLIGVTSNVEDAKKRLERGDVDAVVVVPDDSLSRIIKGQQALLTLYHNEIDPNQSAYVGYFGRVYVNEVNRRILLGLTAEAQKRAGESQKEMNEAQDAIKEARAAILSDDRQRARDALDRLDRSTTALAGMVGVSAEVLQGVKQNLGVQDASLSADNMIENLQQIQADSAEMRRNLESTDQSVESWDAQLRRIEADLAQMDGLIQRLKSIPADVLVSPFATQTETVAKLQPTFVIFYAPAVLALILQHMSVTISALSLVRERLLGAIEVFRVSPISPQETLLGKYLSYMVLSLAIAAILTVLLTLILKVPLLGNWRDYTMVMGLLLFASLGIGFFISAISISDSQAVQLSMLVLLASMFFSGFVMPLTALIWPIRALSYFLPVTYGIITLQDVMLRGVAPSLPYMLALLAEGLILFAASLFIFRRQFVRA